jgi:hypothetical protein
MSNYDRMARVVDAARKRRNSSAETNDRIHLFHDEKTDWKGICQYCKSNLTGTSAELLAHRCKEFEEANEPRS